MKDERSPASPTNPLCDIDASTLRKIVQAAADVAVVVDASGVVRDLMVRQDELRRELLGSGRWVGRKWRSTVTIESLPKLDALLSDAADDRPMRWRHVNHPTGDGVDVAISYAAVQLTRTGAVIVLGRDLRPIVALQQRLVGAQRALERDYSSLRQAEARYRMLFESSPDAVAILDADTLKLLDVNPAGRQLLALGNRRVAVASFIDCFDADSRPKVRQALNVGRAVGRSETVQVGAGTSAVNVSVVGLRDEDNPSLFVRMTRQRFDAAGPAPANDDSQLPGLLARMPDAVAVTDDDGDLVEVNAAFRALIGISPSEPLGGEALGRWVGHDGVDLGVLIANLRQRGTVRLFATTLRTQGGGITEIEISASAMPNGVSGFAFFIRNVARRLPPETRLGGGVARSADRISELIGRVPLKELVRESTTAIERLCIEAALEMTGNNRASAAEMLGLSRQSLYVKLRRYGLGEADEGEGESA